MVSPTHEAVVMVFRNRPELAPESVRSLGIELPEYTEAKIHDSRLSVPQAVECLTDLIVLLVDDKPVFGIVVEVQLQEDEDKWFSWPLYEAMLWADLRCPACVLVVTLSESVKAWASRSVRVGPTAVFRPVVMGPKHVPIVLDPEEAKANPELAVLSAMAHGKDDLDVAVAVASAALAAVDQLGDRRATFYGDFVLNALSVAARRMLEEMMNIHTYQFQSDFVRRNVAQGEVKSKADAVLTVLGERRRKITEMQREQILACTDLPTLDRWLRRAVKVSKVKDLFEEDERVGIK